MTARATLLERLADAKQLRSEAREGVGYFADWTLAERRKALVMLGTRIADAEMALADAVAPGGVFLHQRRQ